jgi:hypothetical protein
MNRAYQTTALAGNMENITGNQKAQIADLLEIEVSMVDGYLYLNPGVGMGDALK